VKYYNSLIMGLVIANMGISTLNPVEEFGVAAAGMSGVF